jgi:hypothetical protein
MLISDARFQNRRQDAGATKLDDNRDLFTG